MLGARRTEARVSGPVLLHDSRPGEPVGLRGPLSAELDILHVPAGDQAVNAPHPRKLDARGMRNVDCGMRSHSRCLGSWARTVAQCGSLCYLLYVMPTVGHSAEACHL